MGAVHATLYMDNCCRIITAAMASLTPAVCSGVAVPVGSCACCDYIVKTKHNETGEVERCGEQIGAGRSIETIEIKKQWEYAERVHTTTCGQCSSSEPRRSDVASLGYTNTGSCACCY